MDFKKLCAACKAYRESIGYTQLEVSKDIGYSVASISAFENGRVNNAQILLWYIQKGMVIEDGKDL